MLQKMRIIRNIVQCIDAISEFVGMAARWLTVVMMLILLYEVGARYVFNAPTIWAHHSCGILWGIFITLGGCYVLRHEAHVKLDLIYRRFSRRGQAIMDSVTYLFFFIYCIVILWYAVPWAWTSLMKFEHALGLWRPPIWPLKMVVPIAVFLLMLQGIARYIRSLYLAITGRELV